MEYPKHGLKSWYWSIDRLPILAIYQLISANKLHAILPTYVRNSWHPKPWSKGWTQWKESSHQF